MRIDRFITLYIFKHLTKVIQETKGIRLPILMYHSISDETESGHPYYWINTSPKIFYEHMKYLKDNNYKAISLNEAVQLINQYKPGQPDRLEITNRMGRADNLKCFVLTFDDGYLDFYTNAFPIIWSFGFTATIFLPTAFIGNQNSGLRGKKHLDWSQVRELQKYGITFGSHTVNHRQLWKTTDFEIEVELRKSKEIIEEKTNKNVEEFCYPYWFPEQDIKFVDRFKGLLGNVGYKCGTGTRIGSFHKPSEIMTLKRIPVNSGDDLYFFSEKISGNYDWIRRVQFLYKKLAK